MSSYFCCCQPFAVVGLSAHLHVAETYTIWEGKIKLLLFFWLVTLVAWSVDFLFLLLFPYMYTYIYNNIPDVLRGRETESPETVVVPPSLAR